MRNGRMNILLADNGTHIRERLEQIIRREKSDIAICCIADNGSDAVERMIRCRPELVLLDLDIPGKEGIEVIREARERGFEGEIIILSSRPEFQDARTVIQYGVSDFLMKPVDEEELAEAIRAVKEKTDRRSKRERSLHQYMKRARALVLYELMCGGEFDPSLNYSELGLEAGIYQVVIRENISTRRREVILLKGQSALEEFQLWKNSAEEFVFLAYGEAVSDIREIVKSYSQCETLLKRRFFGSKDRHILSFEELPEDGGEIRIDSAMGEIYGRKLFEDIKAESRAGLLRTLAELLEYVRQNNFEVSSVRYFLVDIFLQVKQHITDAYGSGAGRFFEGNTALIKRIESEPFLQGISDYLAEQFEKAIYHIRKKHREDGEEGRKYEDDHSQ